MTWKSGDIGLCPHCKIANRFEGTTAIPHRTLSIIRILEGKSDSTLTFSRCTNCLKNIIFMDERMIYPLGVKRPLAPIEVPKKIAEDFNEACLTQPLSEKASAALTRRCLQNMLHDQGIKKDNLSKEIDEVILNLPKHLSEAVDAIRTVGNFAAHPIKSQSTGELIEVEPGEVEWNLDTIEQLFDFYYVAPKKTQQKRDRLNIKLQDAGKPALKEKTT